MYTSNFTFLIAIIALLAAFLPAKPMRTYVHAFLRAYALLIAGLFADVATDQLLPARMSTWNMKSLP